MKMSPLVTFFICTHKLTFSGNNLFFNPPSHPKLIFFISKLKHSSFIRKSSQKFARIMPEIEMQFIQGVKMLMKCNIMTSPISADEQE